MTDESKDLPDYECSKEDVRRAIAEGLAEISLRDEGIMPDKLTYQA